MASREIKISDLDEKRFNALASQSRSPAAAYISRELGWFTNEDESVIGVLLLDIVDDDYGAVVLARDENGAYRAIDVDTSIDTEEDALTWLHGAKKVAYRHWENGISTRRARKQDCPI